MLLLQFTVPIITCGGCPRRPKRTSTVLHGLNVSASPQGWPRSKACRGIRLTRHARGHLLFGDHVSTCFSGSNWFCVFIVHIYACVSLSSKGNSRFKRKRCSWNLITKILFSVSSFVIPMVTCSECLSVYPLSISDVTVAAQRGWEDTLGTLRVQYLLHFPPSTFAFL